MRLSSTREGGRLESRQQVTAETAGAGGTLTGFSLAGGAGACSAAPGCFLSLFLDLLRVSVVGLGSFGDGARRSQGWKISWAPSGLESFETLRLRPSLQPGQRSEQGVPGRWKDWFSIR